MVPVDFYTFGWRKPENNTPRKGKECWEGSLWKFPRPKACWNYTRTLAHTNINSRFVTRTTSKRATAAICSQMKATDLIIHPMQQRTEEHLPRSHWHIIITLHFRVHGWGWPPGCCSHWLTTSSARELCEQISESVAWRAIYYSHNNSLTLLLRATKKPQHPIKGVSRNVDLNLFLTHVFNPLFSFITRQLFARIVLIYLPSRPHLMVGYSSCLHYILKILLICSTKRHVLGSGFDDF